MKYNKSLKIKICGLKYDIVEISDLNPDFLGFIFYSKSPRFFSKNFIIPKLKKEIFKTGIFVNETIENIMNISYNNKLDFIQLHGNESPFFCKKLFDKGFRIIKSFKINNSFIMKTLSSYIPFCSYFLFDNNGGSGKKFCWNILKKYNFDIPFFLSGGISSKDLKKIKEFNHPKIFGIDINSKFEIYPGKKNKEMIKSFIEKIKKI
ncbi:phosphoribosylanthranilate isomerase [Blattabacterium cuenoti]|uniref:phosphoribosylanthranilate isomerase n=1 Tax=Blattabacterium cuenoti TaxID=1653831 RepID=UPI00163C84EB|nr:phosphoribosylanthranilate isomerase [Blattabacterium cuenoti]